MSSTATSKAEATRQRIVQAAEGLFYENGYTATGLDRILTAAGITKGNFYYHFKSKEALLLAVIDEHFAQRRDAIAELFAKGQDKPLETLFAVMDLLLEMEREQHAAGQIKGCFFGNLSLEMCNSQQPVQHKVSHVFGSLSEVFLSLLELAQQRGELAEGIDPQQMAEVILSAMEGALLVDKANQQPGKLESSIGFFKHHLSRP